MNFKLVATKVGDFLKYDTSVNAINRTGKAVFPFEKEPFPKEGITSARASEIYDWVLTLGKQRMDGSEKVRMLRQFCLELAAKEDEGKILSFLESAGFSVEDEAHRRRKEFLSRGFHAEVVKHSLNLFVQGNYNHSVFEACKAYNLSTKTKAISTKDGNALMLDVWGWEKGTLKLTRCVTETEKNIQEGMKFMSAGIMQAIRNPTAHEPVLFLESDEKDALDVLAFISFLFRKLDKAVYFKV